MKNGITHGMTMILWPSIKGAFYGFVASLLLLVALTIWLSVTEESDSLAAIPLGYMFLILPSCLTAGLAVGLMCGIWRAFDEE